MLQTMQQGSATEESRDSQLEKKRGFQVSHVTRKSWLHGLNTYRKCVCVCVSIFLTHNLRSEMGWKHLLCYTAEAVECRKLRTPSIKEKKLKPKIKEQEAQRKEDVVGVGWVTE